MDFAEVEREGLGWVELGGGEADGGAIGGGAGEVADAGVVEVGPGFEPGDADLGWCAPVGREAESPWGGEGDGLEVSGGDSFGGAVGKGEFVGAGGRGVEDGLAGFVGKAEACGEFGCGGGFAVLEGVAA